MLPREAENLHRWHPSCFAYLITNSRKPDRPGVVPRVPDAANAAGDYDMLSLVHELGRYMSARKKWWLFPVISILFLVGGLLVLAKGSAIAPFIYTVF